MKTNYGQKFYNGEDIICILYFRLLRSQSKVKELTRDLRNTTEESDEYKRKLESVKNERRRMEKNIFDVNIYLVLLNTALVLFHMEFFYSQQ